jgi:solute carrier family 6 (neurotransmitter transporter, glycine) member 5/9
MFRNDVIHAKENISEGIGWPIWNLLGFLILSWGLVFVILLKGIKSAGKSSYVLAIFPYVILVILLVKALTLEV